MQNRIIIEDPDPNWSATFERIRLALAIALGSVALRIEHVGSTAIPNLPAKPIIDIDVIIDSESDLPIAIDRLARIGYTYQGDQGISRATHFVPATRNLHTTCMSAPRTVLSSIVT